jgi:hypothetical protein
MGSPDERRRKRRLVVLYQNVADLTKDQCRISGSTCKAEVPCCRAVHCEEAIRYAAAYWNVTLVPTGHDSLPLMGGTGCVAAPHLRPICSIHHCEISSVGVFVAAPPYVTDRYFELRDQIEDLDYEVLEDAGVISDR